MSGPVRIRYDITLDSITQDSTEFNIDEIAIRGMPPPSYRLQTTTNRSVENGQSRAESSAINVA